MPSAVEVLQSLQCLTDTLCQVPVYVGVGVRGLSCCRCCHSIETFNSSSASNLFRSQHTHCELEALQPHFTSSFVGNVLHTPSCTEQSSHRLAFFLPSLCVCGSGGHRSEGGFTASASGSTTPVLRRCQKSLRSSIHSISHNHSLPNELSI